MGDQVSPVKVALDSNVWRYLVDEDQVEELRRISKRRRVEIVALPAVLYESLRMPPSPKRDRLLEAQTRQVWFRAMPEAFSESEELRRAIADLRPEWLAPTPDLREWHRLVNDWAHDGRSGTWSRSRRNASDMARWIGDGQIPTARLEAKAARQVMLDLGLSFDAFKVEAVESWFDQPAAGWDGSHFQAWRAESLNVWTPVLARSHVGAYSDWLRPWIEPERILGDFASWVRFWIDDVTEHQMPRQWIRSAMRLVAATRTTSNGTPVDIQISTYLYDCDVFFTSDRIFAECVEKIRPQAPGVLAAAHLLPGGSAAAGALLHALGDLAV